MNTLARDANINGFQEVRKSLESVLNAKALIGIGREKNELEREDCSKEKERIG